MSKMKIWEIKTLAQFTELINDTGRMEPRSESESLAQALPVFSNIRDLLH